MLDYLMVRDVLLLLRLLSNNVLKKETSLMNISAPFLIGMEHDNIPAL